MSYRIVGLSSEPFQHLYGQSDVELAANGVRRCVVDAKPGFPDRIEMRDGEIGETFLLLNHVSMPAATPYRATHAIFIREGATETYNKVGEVPEAMRIRLLSLRAFDKGHMMIDADVIDGKNVEALIDRFLSNAAVSYIHVHNAKPGCYHGRIERA